MKSDTSAKVNSRIKMKQPLMQFLILLLFMSCLCLKERKKGRTGKTHVVMQDKKWWKIKTADDGANEKGADYQEDDLNRERLCSYLISYKIFFLLRRPFLFQLGQLGKIRTVLQFNTGLQ